MTHFAAVAPLAIHRGLDEVEALGSYQLLIASEVLRDLEAHAAFWLPKEPDQYVILDNGVIEEGYPLPMIHLIKAADAVGANCIVLPDSIDDMNMTVKLAVRTISDYRTLGHDGRELMGVVQGKSLGECFECASKLINLGVDRLAVPRGLTKHLGTRIHLTTTLANLYNMPIHILGFSDNVADDIATAKLPGVTGIDAATPVWLGLQGVELPVDPPVDSTGWGHRPDYFWKADLDLHDDDGFHYETALIVDNLKRVRSWLSRDASSEPHK